MTPQEGFIARLRWYRQRNRVTLEQIASTTRVQRELLEAFENNDLSRWPRGLYARTWVRGYAAAVGLDPDETVDEFCRLFPQGDRRLRSTIEEIASIVASPSEFREDFTGVERRRASDVQAAPGPAWLAPVTDAGRILIARLNTLKASPYLRPRRAPRTF